MDDYKKIPFDDPDLCVPDLDDFDQMKEFFLDCAAEYFRYLSSDDMEKMLAALGKRVDVLATPTDDVFISVSPDAVLRQYPDITIDELMNYIPGPDFPTGGVIMGDVGIRHAYFTGRTAHNGAGQRQIRLYGIWDHILRCNGYAGILAACFPAGK